MKTLLTCFLLLTLSLHTLYAANSENDVKVAIIGKLSKFITWTNNENSKHFKITVFGDTVLKESLYEKYNGYKLNAKKVIVVEADSIDEIGDSDILYVGKVSHDEQYAFINYSKKNSILTISEEKGFAQRGGIIQFYFISQKLKLKINHETSIESDLKISAALLSIATIVQGKPQ